MPISDQSKLLPSSLFGERIINSQPFELIKHNLDDSECLLIRERVRPVTEESRPARSEPREPEIY